jgi:hypothetical protein
MLEWLPAVVSSILGASAGSAVTKLLEKSHKRALLKEPPPKSLAGVLHQLSNIRDWQGQVEEMLAAQDREIRRLKKQIYNTRVLLDVFLVALLVACLVWLYFQNFAPAVAGL